MPTVMNWPLRSRDISCFSQSNSPVSSTVSPLLLMGRETFRVAYSLESSPNQFPASRSVELGGVVLGDYELGQKDEGDNTDSEVPHHVDHRG